MKLDLEGIVRDVPLRTLALGIALGYSLLAAANGVAAFIEGLAAHGHGVHDLVGNYFPGSQYSLTWIFGGHVFTFGPLVQGLIELGTVLLVAALVRRSARTY